MSVPNDANDPQAPLLVGETSPDAEDEVTESWTNKRIVLFHRSISVFQLLAGVVGTLALIAIAISIAAIGMMHNIMRRPFFNLLQLCLLSIVMMETNMATRSIIQNGKCA
jgi:hypothetical protein